MYVTKVAALFALQNLKLDLEALRSGTRVPDDDSIAASQELIERVRIYVEQN